MATIRTEAQLEAFFADNNTGDISALDGRDFVATFFGLATTTDPGPNNDSQDTAGIGAFFSAGSRWLNVNTQIEWTCFDGTPGLAAWRHASYFGNTPTIVTAGFGISVAFVAPSTYEVSWTGTNTVVDGVSPITVSWDGFFTYTVSLTGTIPTSQITGILPSAQLGSGYPFPSLSGSATPAQLPTLDTTAGATGKLSAGNLTSGYPFSDLAGSATPSQLPNFAGPGFPGIVPDPTGSPTGSYLDKTGAFTVPPSGTGTVTSVGVSMPTEFSVSGSPVTSAGTVAVTKANQTANTVWAGPASGAAAAPTFRALVASDIPPLPASIISSGTLSGSVMPSTVTQSVQYDVDFSQFGSTSGNTKDANIGAIPAGYAVRGAYIRCTTNATNTTGTWGNWQLSTSLGSGDIGTFTAQTAATTSFSQNINGPNRGSLGATNCWMRIVLGATGTLTGGHWKVTLVCDPVA